MSGDEVLTLVDEFAGRAGTTVVEETVRAAIWFTKYDVAGRFDHEGLFLGVPLQYRWWTPLNRGLTASTPPRWIDIRAVWIRTCFEHPLGHHSGGQRPGVGTTIVLMSNHNVSNT